MQLRAENDYVQMRSFPSSSHHCPPRAVPEEAREEGVKSDERSAERGGEGENEGEREATIGTADFHNWLALVRLIALSYGERSITLEHWDKMREMERRRMSRIRKL